MTDLYTWLKNANGETIEHRRALHKIPEIGNDLPQTKAYVKAALLALGLSPKEYALSDSLSVDIQGRGPGRTVALRADMDALPVVEETGLPYASQNGAMHACGHDAHTAVLLTLTKYFLEHKNEFDGTVRLMFQSGEEGAHGASTMIQGGVLEGVDALFACHQGAICDAADDQVTVSPGAMMAATAMFTIKIQGKGGHGAMPWKCVDPIVAAAELISSFQTLPSREASLEEPLIVAIGSVHAGSAPNVVPEFVDMEGTIRAVSVRSCVRLMKRMQNICDGIALAKNVKINIDLSNGYPPVINDERASDLITAVTRELFGPDAVTPLKHPVMIGEDVSEYLQVVPGALFFFHNNNGYPQHNPCFDIREESLPKAGAVLAAAALRFLEKGL